MRFILKDLRTHESTVNKTYREGRFTLTFWRSYQDSYSIGLLSCESIAKPYLDNFLPYKDVSHFKTFHWSRHVSVASSLKGGKIHCSAHYTLYSLSLFHVGQNHYFLIVLIDLLLGG